MFNFLLTQTARPEMSPALLMFQMDDTFPLMLVFLITIPVAVLAIAGMWMVFTKAGEPGWASIVPIYNVIVLLKIADKPLWWILLLLIPFVNIVIGFIVLIDVAHNFGKSTGFGVGLALLGFIFFPILGFGDAQYKGGRQQQNPYPGYGM